MPSFLTSIVVLTPRIYAWALFLVFLKTLVVVDFMPSLEEFWEVVSGALFESL